jgi:hypothetical protein
MKFIQPRPFADPAIAARKIVEIANAGLIDMAQSIFVCSRRPTTGQRVEYKHDGTPLLDQHEIVVCPSCAKVHLLDRQTGKEKVFFRP